MTEKKECLEKLMCEWLDTLIKKDWSIHIEQIIKIYSEGYMQDAEGYTPGAEGYNPDECWYYSNATNIIYNNKLDIIGYMNENGIIKYF